MARYVLNYESGEYEYIERDGFSIDRGEYVYNWDKNQSPNYKQMGLAELQGKGKTHPLIPDP